MLEENLDLRKLGKAQRAASRLNIVPIEVIYLHLKLEGNSSPLNLVVLRNQIGPGRLYDLSEDLNHYRVNSCPLLSQAYEKFVLPNDCPLVINVV